MGVGANDDIVSEFKEAAEEERRQKKEQEELK
jgi:hypothetical protein